MYSEVSHTHLDKYSAKTNIRANNYTSSEENMLFGPYSNQYESVHSSRMSESFCLGKKRNAVIQKWESKKGQL